jgi:hypothetical protein
VCVPINKSGAAAGFRPVDADQANGMEVDLDATDPSKAVDRTRGSILSSGKTESTEASEEDKFLDRSRAVKKRMARMQRSFDQKTAEQQAEFQRQLAERDERLQRLEARREESGPAADEAAHETEMKSLEKQHEAALEKGDSAEATRLAREMAKKEAAFATKKTMAFVEQSNKSRETAATKTAAAAAAPARAAPKTPAAAQEFIDANIDWWEDEEFQVERSAAEVLHRKLIEEGSDPDSRSHYVKLNKRLKAKFPTLEISSPVADEDDDDEAEEPAETRGKRARAPTVGVDRGPPSQGGGNRVRLTPEDVANMRSFGLNPDDNKTVLRYTREKQASEAASRRE